MSAAPEGISTLIAELVARELVEQFRPGANFSPYLTIPEAAELLRCKRQRIDDLLSSGRLTRIKEGGRTLVSRAEIERYLTALP